MKFDTPSSSQYELSLSNTVSLFPCNEVNEAWGAAVVNSTIDLHLLLVLDIDQCIPGESGGISANGLFSFTRAFIL